MNIIDFWSAEHAPYGVDDMPKTYKVRCYDKYGNLHHEEFTGELEIAKQIRTEWGLSIGLRPEPSNDFAYYPTIWKENNDGSYSRLEGY